MIKDEVSANPLDATAQLTTNTITNVSSWEEYLFIVSGMWVKVKKFNSGMISVRSAYNPELIKLLNNGVMKVAVNMSLNLSRGIIGNRSLLLS